MDVTAAIALGISVVTALGALYGHRATARKADVEALRGIIAELRARIDELEQENERLRGRIDELEAENCLLKGEGTGGRRILDIRD